MLSSSAYGQDPPQLLDVRRQSVQRKWYIYENSSSLSFRDFKSQLVSTEFKLIRIRNTCFAITRQGRSGHCISGSSIFLICSQFHWIYSYKDTCKQIRKVHDDKAWSFFFRRVKHYGNYNTMNKEPVELNDKGCNKLLVDPENLNFSAELRVFLCVK